MKAECKRLVISFDKLESRSRRGWPDICLIKNGIVVFVELKSPAKTGRLSPLQKACLADIRAHGGLAYTLYAVDQVDLLLAAFDSALGFHRGLYALLD